MSNWKNVMTKKELIKYVEEYESVSKLVIYIKDNNADSDDDGEKTLKVASVFSITNYTENPYE